jgi:hypothetical protein
MPFVHAFDAIFELATVLRELLGYFVDAAWYFATKRGPDGHSLRATPVGGLVSPIYESTRREK